MSAEPLEARVIGDLDALAIALEKWLAARFIFRRRLSISLKLPK